MTIFNSSANLYHLLTYSLQPPLIPPDVKPRRVYVQQQEKTLTLVTTSQVPQQLMTRLVAVFLKEKLGYVDISITTVPDTFDPGNVIDAMRHERNASDE